MFHVTTCQNTSNFGRPAAGLKIPIPDLPDSVSRHPRIRTQQRPQPSLKKRPVRPFRLTLALEEKP